MGGKSFDFKNLINGYSGETGEVVEVQSKGSVEEKISSEEMEESMGDKDMPNKYNELEAPNISNIPVEQEKRKPGRPKRSDGENKSKHFNLLMRPSTMAALNRIAAKKQLETGNKMSVTELINIILENYIEAEGEKF